MRSDWIGDRWIFTQLGKRWDDRVCVALNDYLASRKDRRTDNLIQGASLLLHHEGLMPSTKAVLARSPQRQKQWLAQIARTSLPTGTH
ncbi:hypothetical protein HYR99_12425 [Candidatus Poribacteria bacterium]|nr:hypothetical protein [Candidatus Poribacteria bacterium]